MTRAGTLEAASRSALEGFDGPAESEAGAPAAGAAGVAAEAVVGEGADVAGAAGGGFDEAHPARAKTQSPRTEERETFMTGTL